MAFSSCSSGGSKDKNGDVILTPETTNIKGDLGDYYEVVEKEYPLSDDVVSVEIKRTDKEWDLDLTGIEPYGYYGQGVYGHAGFGIEVLDENGNVIYKSEATRGGLGGMYSGEDMIEALKLKPGETGTVRWSLHCDSDKVPAKFRLISAYERNENGACEDIGSSDDQSSSDDSYSSGDSYDSDDDDDYDALLDSYEEYVDEYIAFFKKAQKGDVSALTEYPELLEKAQDYSDQLSKAKGSMTSSQVSRFNKITSKMAKAAM